MEVVFIRISKSHFSSSSSMLEYQAGTPNFSEYALALSGMMSQTATISASGMSLILGR